MRLFKRFKKRRALDQGRDLYQNPRADTTFIGRGVFLEGVLACGGNARLSGRCCGKVSSPGIIFLEKGATVKGDLFCINAVIEGSVDGEVHVKEKVELGKSSRVKGDIMAGALAIERGAFLSGNAVSRLSSLNLFKEKRRSTIEG